MATKKNILIISTFATLFVGSLFALNSNYCFLNPFCIDGFIIFFLIPPPILLFSLLTYRMHDEVFRSWWSFARWMVPIIAIVTILIQFVPKNGGFFNMDALIYLLVLAPLYAVLILVSLWKIFSTHRKLKMKTENGNSVN